MLAITMFVIVLLAQHFKVKCEREEAGTQSWVALSRFGLYMVMKACHLQPLITMVLQIMLNGRDLVKSMLPLEFGILTGMFLLVSCSNTF